MEFYPLFLVASISIIPHRGAC